MKKCILAVMFVILTCPTFCAGDVPYEQKPHLEIKCPCGASFTLAGLVTPGWITASIPAGLVTPGWITVSIPAPLPEKKQERLFVRELIGSETAGFILSNWTSSYRCVKCGESLATVYNSNAVWYCSKCERYFNIRKEIK